MSTVSKRRKDGIVQRFHTSPLRPQVVALYKSGMPSRKVGKRIGISHARVLQLLRKEGVPRRPIIKPIDNPRYKELTNERAYLLGVMCGDGCVFSGIEHKKKWTFRSHIVHLTVKDKDFIDEYMRCMKIVYQVTPSLTFRKRRKENWSDMWVARLNRLRIYEDLSPYHFGTKTWTVPKEIKKSQNEEVIGAFLRGFYDSEGSVSVGPRGITISVHSTNIKGLKDVNILVKKLGIATSKMKCDERGLPKKSFYFTITHRRNFMNFISKIGFSIKRKEEKVITYLEEMAK